MNGMSKNEEDIVWAAGEENISSLLCRSFPSHRLLSSASSD